MKTDLQDIVRAFVETAKKVPEGEHESLCKEVLGLLQREGHASSVRTFPRFVREYLRKHERTVFGVITTPSGNADPEKAQIASILEKSMNAKVHLKDNKDETLIAGALLKVGDERFDASIKGALIRLQSYLSSHGPAVA